MVAVEERTLRPRKESSVAVPVIITAGKALVELVRAVGMISLRRRIAYDASFIDSADAASPSKSN